MSGALEPLTYITEDDVTKFAGAMVLGYKDGNGKFQPTSSANPMPVSAPSTEQVFSPSITSAAVYSSGVCLGAPSTIVNGGSLRHLSVDWNTSQTQTISALVLRAATVSSTLTDHTAASIAAADVGKVIGGAVLSATVMPGASGTVWSATGIDIVVSSGAQVVLIAGGTMNSAGAATSGLTVGAGVVG